MSKYVHIYDVKPLNIFLGRKTRGPIKLRLDDAIINRLLHEMNGPRDIYAIDPSNDKHEVKLTVNNCMLPESEIFKPEVKVISKVEPIVEPKEEKIVEDIKVEEVKEEIKLDKEETKEDISEDTIDESEISIDETNTEPSVEKTEESDNNESLKEVITSQNDRPKQTQQQRQQQYYKNNHKKKK